VTPSAFLRALAPVLVAELAMFLVVRNLPASNDQASFLALALVSWLALPALAGFRVSRSGGGLLLASVGGTAVSGVTLVCAAISELLITRDALAFGGLILATLMIAIPIQALSGFLAGWAARRRGIGGA
jgi:hypothetical protein